MWTVRDLVGHRPCDHTAVFRGRQASRLDRPQSFEPTRPQGRPSTVVPHVLLETRPMIISHKYKYVYVRLPHTASNTISKELCENYEGVSILREHAYYHEFLKIANVEEKRYFVFSGIRNPLDEAVSIYFRKKTNREDVFTEPELLRKHGGFFSNQDLKKFAYIRDHDIGFSAYFKAFYPLIYIHRFPYDNWSLLSHEKFNFVIRFEKLQKDFAEALKLLGIKQKRLLPVVNRTDERKKEFLSYYTPETYEQAKRVFGPFMKKWGYEFPSEWRGGSVPWWTQVHFQFLGIIRKLYWRYLPYDSPLVSRFEQIVP